MRITRGDNIAFFLVAGISLLALVGSFVAGKIYSAVFDKVIVVTNNSESKIEYLTISCADSAEQISLAQNEKAELRFSECEGEILFRIGENTIGSCKTGIDGFSKLDVQIKKAKISSNDCKFE